MKWIKDIRDRRQVVEFVDYILKYYRGEICTKEALDLIKKSGNLKFNLTIRKLGHILADSQQFNHKYKYNKYCKEKATVWSRKDWRSN